MGGRGGGGFVRAGTSVWYTRYNMTTGRLCIGRGASAGALLSPVPSFTAPLKVNREPSNGPVVFIKKGERERDG